MRLLHHSHAVSCILRSISNNVRVKWFQMNLIIDHTTASHAHSGLTHNPLSIIGVDQHGHKINGKHPQRRLQAIGLNSRRHFFKVELTQKRQSVSKRLIDLCVTGQVTTLAGQKVRPFNSSSQDVKFKSYYGNYEQETAFARASAA